MDTHHIKGQAVPVTRNQKIIMLATFLRVAEAFRVAKDTLSPEQFDETEDLALSLIWRATLEHYQEYSERPAEKQLIAQLNITFERMSSMISDADIEEIGNIIVIIFELLEEELKSKFAIKVMQRVMSEDLHRSARVAMETASADDLPKLLRENLRHAERIATLNITTVPDPFAGGLQELKPVVTTTTGVSFLDDYMAGGSSPGEVYGFLGPYGSCKTTLSVMLAVERAKYEQKKWISEGKKGKLPMVYLVVWEEEMNSLRIRALSYAARISRKSLEGQDYLDRLSRTGNLKDYERKLFQAQIQNGIEVKGEFERANLWMKRLGRNLRFIDFTGAEPSYSEASANLAEGVADVIHTDQENSGDPGVGLVILDYIGAAVNKHIAHNNLNVETALRHKIRETPMALKERVAIPFDCPVWAFHQLNTDANSKRSSVAPKATDAAECKSFCENLNFAFMVGVPTKESHCVFTTVKQRRTERHPDRIIHIDGDLCRVQDTNGRYMLSHNQIVPTADMARVVDDVPGTTGTVGDGDRALFSEVGV